MELDAAIGLYYDRARIYDPQSGRFIAEDPISFVAGDTNLFRYCGNSPANLLDPSGLDGITQEQCDAWWKKLAELEALLAADLAKYDPVRDAVGGDRNHATGDPTVPGGHAIENDNTRRAIDNLRQKIDRFCGNPGEPVKNPPGPRPPKKTKTTTTLPNVPNPNPSAPPPPPGGYPPNPPTNSLPWWFSNNPGYDWIVDIGVGTGVAIIGGVTSPIWGPPATVVVVSLLPAGGKVLQAAQ